MPVRLAIPPAPPAAVEAVGEALGLSRVTASALVRRGLADPEAARRFLELEGPQHDPLALGDMAAAVDLIAAAIAGGRRIVVHGDYDADGVCATALACEALAGCGAVVEPFLPSRFDEGYGLATETVERLHAEGCELLITVDCGITAVDAAARARALGLDLIVTDHHRPADDLPDAPLVVTRGRGDYPFPELCGTGVAFKLAQAVVARTGADPAILERVLDLVAVATVADVVPLVDENRGLVRAGLRRLRGGGRPGLEALLAVARVDRARAGAGEIAFRVAPRINACGRLGHPAAALELLLTDDVRRARELAERLDELNRERQAVEDRILRDALARHEALDEPRRQARGLVLWSEDWHPGVVGIVASRLVERLRRPVVLIAVEGDEGRGSGRSLPVYDLHAGLAACAEHLVAFGGHRVAAGVTIRADRLDDFARAFAAHADDALSEDDLRPTERVDAVASIGDISLELADELARLEPFGLGNPGVAVLLPAVELAEAQTLGADAKHLRYVVRSSAGSCRVVQWGAGRDVDAFGAGRYDVVARVERNDWNGSSSVQLIARGALPVADEVGLPAGLCATPCDAACPDRARPSTFPPADHGLPGPGGARRHPPVAAAALAELVRLAAGGEGLLVVVADIGRRRALLRHALHPERFGLLGALLFSRRCAEHAIDARLELAAEGSWIALVDHDTLARRPDLAAPFRHVAILDPPASAASVALIDGLPAGTEVHGLVGPQEQALARRVHAARAPRGLAATVWRALGDAPLAADEVHESVAADGTGPDAAETAWALEVLEDAGLIRRAGDGFVRDGAPGDRVDLTVIPGFADAVAAHEAGGETLEGRRPALAV